MSRRKTLCQQYEGKPLLFDNALGAGRYLAAVESVPLPRATTSDNRIVRRGYAVGFGEWFFFPALEPAITFGRAARMSLDCLGYGVYEAAHETLCCPLHGDERVLHVDVSASLDRRDGEVDVLTRFVEHVRKYPDSPNWWRRGRVTC